MQLFLKAISMLLALIMSYFIVGNPDGFQPHIVEKVTTETKQITILGENKTGNKIGDPRIVRIEQLIDEKWVFKGEPIDINSDYSTYNPLSTFKYTLQFTEIDAENNTLPVGEYRIVIAYNLITSKGNKDCFSYAYFTITE